NELVGLFEDDYIQLIRVAEAIHKSLQPPVVTFHLLKNLIFVWVKKANRKTINDSVTDYVLHECEKLITEAEIWIPISHFYIPRPFAFGRITFRARTIAMMDEWETSALAKCTTDDERTAVKTGMERRRRKFQALEIGRA